MVLKADQTRASKRQLEENIYIESMVIIHCIIQIKIHNPSEADKKKSRVDHVMKA